MIQTVEEAVVVTVQKASNGKVKQHIDVNGIELFADVPVENGGDNAGPDGHGLLDAALGACTALTLTMVAQRKQIPLKDARVTITHTEEQGVYHLQRQVELTGELSEEQRAYLLGIANKCPIHKVLSGKIKIDTSLV
jgi:putative redox protein